MRCADCNKFVSFDDGNVDDVEVEIDEETGEVTVSGRVVLPCAECGTDLAEADLDDTVETADEFELTVTEAIKAQIPEGTPGRKDVTDTWVEEHATVAYEFDGDPDKEFCERVQDTVQVPVRKGGKVVGHKTKKLKDRRYMKTYKGVAVSGTVKRTVSYEFDGRDGQVVDTAEFEHTTEEQSSAFSEC